jgi:hypothetical protein
VTTRELIEAEIERLSEQELDVLYKVLKSLGRSKRYSGQSLMSKLQSIRIDGPEDFSSNFELYASGEKGAESDIR